MGDIEMRFERIERRLGLCPDFRCTCNAYWDPDPGYGWVHWSGCAIIRPYVFLCAWPTVRCPSIPIDDPHLVKDAGCRCPTYQDATALDEAIKKW